MNLNKFINQISIEAVFWSGIGLILILFVVYGMLINQTVRNIVSREKIIGEIAEINSKIADYESKLLTLSNAVTLEVAYEKGFVDVKNVIYLKKRQSVGSLSFNNEE